MKYKKIILIIFISIIFILNVKADDLIKLNTAPVFNIKINANSLVLNVYDTNGINRENIYFYRVDSNRNITEKIEIDSCDIIKKSGSKNIQYKCYINRNALKNENNFYIVINDNTKAKISSYFKIKNNSNGKYAKYYAPKIKTWKLINNKEIQFTATDSGTIKSVIVRDINNGEKIVVQKSNQKSPAAVNIDIKGLKLTDGISDIEITTEDTDGNLCKRRTRIKISDTIINNLNNNNSTNNNKTTTNNSSNNVKVTKIGLNKTNIELSIGSTYKLTQTVTPSNASNKNVTWSSSNPQIATVDKNGNVKGIKAGTANIIATSQSDNKIKATCSVKVTNTKVEVKKITLNKTSITTEIGATTKLTTTIEPTNASNKGVTWKSSDTTVATVDQNGNIKGIKAGTAVITASSKSNPNIKATCNVTVNIIIEKKNITLTVGKYTKLSSNLANKNIKLTSSNNNVATVKEGNRATITAINPGVATITAILKSNTKIRATFTITVKAQPKEAYNASIGFLPTQQKYTDTITTGSGQAIMIKASDGSLAMIDTGHKKDGYEPICQKVVSYMRAYANKNSNQTLKIKYMIISHAHSDHYSCLKDILNSKNIKIENIIVKKEKNGISTPYNVAEEADKKGKTNLIRADKKNEDYVLNLGNLKLHLFNMSDIYKNETKEKCKYTQQHLYFKHIKENGNTDLVIKIKGNDGKTYYPYIKTGIANTIYYSTEIIKGKKDSNGAPMYLYAHMGQKNNKACSSNANSIATLVEIPVGNDKRYAYLPADIDNNGYPFNGKSEKIDGKNVIIAGHGNQYFYKNHTEFNKDGTINTKKSYYESKNGKLVENTSKIVYRPQEYKTALAISKKIDKNKIIIYQSAHHGGNNDPASINVLNLNRNNIYYVIPRKNSQKNGLNDQHIRNYWYTTSNISKDPYIDTNTNGYGYYYADGFIKYGILDLQVKNNGKVTVNYSKS